MMDENVKLGFIGCGKMAQALAKGFLDAGLVKCSNVIASGIGEQNRMLILKDCNIRTTTDNTDVCTHSDIIIIAVKPHIVDDVLPVIRENYHNQLIISIASGITLSHMEQALPAGSRVVRTVPNTPSMVQCGATVYAVGEHVTQDDSTIVTRLFSAVGICELLPERLLDSVTGLSGSGPAYCYMAIEALSDGGVRMGLPRAIAQRLAAQTLMGAGKMVLESGKHPGQLKDEVCSPAGTTIAAVQTLEQQGYRAALINAVQSSATRAKELGGSSS